jgi:peroxiredoxin
MATLLKLIAVLRRRKAGSPGGLIPAWLLFASLAVLLGGCCTVIPTAPDYSAYAPTLAPPVTQCEPNVGTSVGCLAPDFKLTGLSGLETSLSDYRGRPVLLNFWTYCSACKEELPYIQTVYDGRETSAPDLVVLAVNVTQPPEQVEEFVSYYGYTFDFLLDTWATVASDYYVHEIPTTFFIDKNGIIADVFVGEFSGPVMIAQKVTALASR